MGRCGPLPCRLWYGLRRCRHPASRLCRGAAREFPHPCPDGALGRGTRGGGRGPDRLPENHAAADRYGRARCGEELPPPGTFGRRADSRFGGGVRALGATGRNHDRGARRGRTLLRPADSAAAPRAVRQPDSGTTHRRCAPLRLPGAASGRLAQFFRQGVR